MIWNAFRCEKIAEVKYLGTLRMAMEHRRDFSKQEDRIYERWSFKSEIPSLFRFWDDEMLACKRRDEVVLSAGAR